MSFCQKNSPLNMCTGFIPVMENLQSHGVCNSNSRPGKSWTFVQGHGKSWKSNMLSEDKKQKKVKN